MGWYAAVARLTITNTHYIYHDRMITRDHNFRPSAAASSSDYLLTGVDDASNCAKTTKRGKEKIGEKEKLLRFYRSRWFKNR